jgi:hypothetical protein
LSTFRIARNPDPTGGHTPLTVRQTLVCAALAALVAVTPAAAALPRAGVLVAGASLGGVRLGESAAQVHAGLGVHGVCSACARPTWYFTYRPFDNHGLGVELSGGRVSAVYTLWQPRGWRGPDGLVLGTGEDQVNGKLGPLLPIACAGYAALVKDTAGTRTAYYVRNNRLWGFGLLRAKADPCR